MTYDYYYKTVTNLIEDFFLEGTSTKCASKFPFYNIFVRDDALIYSFALAGYTKDDLVITLEGDTFTLDGSSSVQDDTKKEKVLYQGITKKDFSIAFKLPTWCINEHDPEVSFTDGILEVAFPLREESKKRTIRID